MWGVSHLEELLSVPPAKGNFVKQLDEERAIFPGHHSQPQDKCRLTLPFTSQNSWTLCFTTVLRKWWATSWLFLQHSCSLFEGFSPSDFKCFYKVFKLGNHIWYAWSRSLEKQSQSTKRDPTRSQERLSKVSLGRERLREKETKIKGRHWLYEIGIPPESDSLSGKEACGKTQKPESEPPEGQGGIFNLGKFQQ